MLSAGGMAPGASLSGGSALGLVSGNNLVLGAAGSLLGDGSTSGVGWVPGIGWAGVGSVAGSAGVGSVAAPASVLLLFVVDGTVRISVSFRGFGSSIPGAEIPSPVVAGACTMSGYSAPGQRVQ
ncbi:MAG TPA: hypothetical protein VFE46_01265 [Pirellulales bacterium]|nr:hypothetical protein [Pirellulales bacterium]